MPFAHLPRAFCLSLFLASAILLSGCMVETETALTDRADAQVDMRLLGAWRLPLEQDENGLLLIRRSDDGGMDVLTLEIRNRGEDEPASVQWETATVWPTKVGKVDLLNVQMDKGKMIVGYRVDPDGSFSFGFMKTEPVIAAIEAGKLKGTVSKGMGTRGAKLQDTPEKITAFIRDTGGYDLFQFDKEKGGVRLERYKPK